LKVIVPDMRGYGRSDKPAGAEAYTMDLLVGDVGATASYLSEEQLRQIYRLSRIAADQNACG
jgi:pimeloyl-ACP methyl ester carboxylesterase